MVNVVGCECGDGELMILVCFQKQGMHPGGPEALHGAPPPYDAQGRPIEPANFETNFDVDGQIETRPMNERQQHM